MCRYGKHGAKARAPTPDFWLPFPARDSGEGGPSVAHSAKDGGRGVSFSTSNPHGIISFGRLRFSNRRSDGSASVEKSTIHNPLASFVICSSMPSFGILMGIWVSIMDDQTKTAGADEPVPPRKSKPKIKTQQKPHKKKTAKKSGTGKGTPWTFPKNVLEDAIRIAQAIEEKNAGNPMPAPDLAVAVGFKQSTDWRFGDLLRSAWQYGLVSGTGATASISLTSLGQDIVAPSSPTQRSEALLAAFRSVSDFAAVEKFYGGKRIPEDEFFLNTLTREFSIPRDRVDTFARVFLENLRYLRAFTPSVGPDISVPSVDDASPGATPPEKIPNPAVSREPRVREFLDTCFVMMPFGAWFDRYYQEIYVPAIKEAGFEPIRADELFSTGSVVEQIWDQIEKSKLLLADLSGKNPNVFYELGLAHAARKPVVFTASNVDDVPFDLRHLRVIVYDVREPEWAPRLRKSIADYLRNATREPGKSIPHPFRRFVEELEQEQSANQRARKPKPAIA
jgi:hypothetical protein